MMQGRAGARIANVYVLGALAAALLAAAVIVYRSWNVRETIHDARATTLETIPVLDDMGFTAVSVQGTVTRAALLGDEKGIDETRHAIRHIKSLRGQLQRIGTDTDILATIDEIVKNFETYLDAGRALSFDRSAASQNRMVLVDKIYKDSAVLYSVLKELKQRHVHDLSDRIRAIESDVYILVAASLLVVILGVMASIASFGTPRGTTAKTPSGHSVQLFEEDH